MFYFDSHFYYSSMLIVMMNLENSKLLNFFYLLCEYDHVQYGMEVCLVCWNMVTYTFNMGKCHASI